MKFTDDFIEVDIIPKFYSDTGHYINISVADDAPEIVQKWAEKFKKRIYEGEYKTFNDVVNALDRYIRRENLLG